MLVQATHGRIFEENAAATVGLQPVLVWVYDDGVDRNQVPV